MVKRKIVKIDEEKCNGCGECVPNCAEGALRIVDGKAKLVKDIYCDGLGACLGHCPQGAITIEEREAEAFDEEAVNKHMKQEKKHECSCPGGRAIDFSDKADEACCDTGTRPSELRQWPVEMHLITPQAPYFQGADLLLAADCTAFSYGDFHKDLLKGKKLVIACPKLDDGQDVYLDKLVALIDQAKINTLTVVIMEVPCCGGLLHLAKQAAAKASRKIPIKVVVIGLQGSKLKEEWV